MDEHDDRAGLHSRASGPDRRAEQYLKVLANILPEIQAQERVDDLNRRVKEDVRRAWECSRNVVGLVGVDAALVRVVNTCVVQLWS